MRRIEMTDRIDEILDGRVSAFLDSRDDAERRRWTRELNRKIGGLNAQPYKPEFMPQGDMLERCLYVDNRDEVVVLPPEWAADNGMTLMCVPPKHFKQMQNGNLGEHPTRRMRDGSPALVPLADLWLAAVDRNCVRDAMYAIGRPRYIHTPSGDLAVNLWTPLKRLKSETDILLFLNHIDYLFGVPNATIDAHRPADIPAIDEAAAKENTETRNRFLDWLAHCEQKPWELPHHGWLMWTEKFGVGRNWLASILTRVWQGEVAPSLDLIALLGGTFNNAISCKRAAFVDEIHIGTHAAIFTLAARLRQLMTEEIRVINPKYGKMTMEYNATRWIVFSNHADALPIPEDDRRFEIARNPGWVMPEAYYARLYKALDDPEFVAGVSFFLAKRDITDYNAGAKPRMTSAKQHVIDASVSETEKGMVEVLDGWKAAGVLMFAMDDLKLELGIDPRGKDSLKYPLDRYGAVYV